MFGILDYYKSRLARFEVSECIELLESMSFYELARWFVVETTSQSVLGENVDLDGLCGKGVLQQADFLMAKYSK